MLRPPTHLTGAKFGQLTVVWARVRLDESGKKRIFWKCICQCGDRVEVREEHLVSRATVSCGCIGKAATSARSRTHGKSKTKTYEAWANARTKCTNAAHKDFSRFGGRGIGMCERWLESFENFLADMGEAPAGAQLRRLNTDENFEPENCVWRVFTSEAGPGRNQG